MKLHELQRLAKALDIDIEQPSNLIYIFYSTPDGRVNTLTVSMKRAKLPNGRNMSDADLAALMQEYPDARDGRIMAVERPRGNLHRWVDREDVKQILHTSTSTIKRWERLGLLHPSRMGRRIYYDAGEVDRVLESNIIQENGRLDKTALDLH
ncbi:MAG: helix-turn-helix domain-containing protein [Bacteroidales bacterium]|nr:helix-turn-helix domain-containing protein [Bacteroidales bacterium]